MMKIDVSVICSDKTIEVPWNILFDYFYFDKVLTNGLTTVSYVKKEITNEIGNKFTFYEINIPHVTVECSSDVFEKLLSGDYYTNISRISDYLVELMFYNNMYHMGLKITIYSVDCYCSKLVHFLKQKLPTINIFNIIIHGGLWLYKADIMSKSFQLCVKNELDSTIICDMFEYIKIILCGEGDFKDDSRCKTCSTIMNIFDSVIIHSAEHKKIIEKQINDTVIKQCIQKCIQHNEYKCTLGYQQEENIIKFNKFITRLFEKLYILETLGYINVANIGMDSDFFFKQP